MREVITDGKKPTVCILFAAAVSIAFLVLAYYSEVSATNKLLSFCALFIGCHWIISFILGKTMFGVGLVLTPDDEIYSFFKYMFLLMAIYALWIGFDLMLIDEAHLTNQLSPTR
jgi:hypothetical protein